MTPSRGRVVSKARRTQPSRIAAHARSDEGGVLAVRRPKSRGRTAGTRTKLGEAERRFWRGGRLRRPQQAAFMRWVLVVLVVGGCWSAGYLSQQGLGQLQLMRARRRVAEVLADPSVDPDTKRRLRLATRARDFGVR